MTGSKSILQKYQNIIISQKETAMLEYLKNKWHYMTTKQKAKIIYGAVCLAIIIVTHWL